MFNFKCRIVFNIVLHILYKYNLVFNFYVSFPSKCFFATMHNNRYFLLRGMQFSKSSAFVLMHPGQLDLNPFTAYYDVINCLGTELINFLTKNSN